MTERNPLATLAEDLMAEHRLARDALPGMLERVMADDDLRNAAIVDLIEGACLRFLEGASATRYSRQKRLSGSGPVGKQRSSDLTAWAGSVANSLMDDFTLPSGKRLGDATRADLETALAAYQTAAQDARIKHDWLRLVLQGLTEGQSVRDRYTDERLAELRAEARKVEA